MCALRVATAPLAQVCEATWHAGHTLADTLLTCLYLQAPEQLSKAAQPLVGALVAGARSSLGLALSLATRADIYEEEDLGLTTFGFSFAGDATLEGRSESTARLAAAGRWLEAHPDAIAEEETRSALAQHLRLRCALVEAHGAFEGCAGSRAGAQAQFAARAALSDAHAALQALRARPRRGEGTAQTPSRVGFDPAVSRRLLGGALPRATKLLALPDALAALHAHVHQLGAVLDGCAGARCRTLGGLVSWLDAFTRGELGDPAQHTHPSPPATLARSIALIAMLPDQAELAAMALEDVWAPSGVAAGVVHLSTPASPAPPSPPPLASSPPAVHQFLVGAARACDALLRALACSRPRSRRRLRHVTAEWAPLCDAAHRCEGRAPPAAPPQEEPRDGAAALGGLSLSDGAVGVVEPQLCPPELVPAWVASQASPGWAGSWFGQHALSGWACRWSCAVQAAHLEAGLSLELYGRAELGPLFWYLEYLHGWQEDGLAQGEEAALREAVAEPGVAALCAAALRARDALTAARQAAQGSPPGDRRQRRAAEVAAEEAAAVARAAQQALQRAAQPRPAPGLARMHAMRLACSAYVCLLIGLEAGGRLARPETPYNQDFHRFWQRYGTFHNYATPPALYYDQWEAQLRGEPIQGGEAGQPPGEEEPRGGPPQPETMYALAAERFRTASAALRELGEPVAARGCAMNAVAAQLLLRTGAGGALVTALEQGPYRGWPVLKVSSGA